jgi:hypothetical protein
MGEQMVASKEASWVDEMVEKMAVCLVAEKVD